jgi:hypothetical protein
MELRRTSATAAGAARIPDFNARTCKVRGEHFFRERLHMRNRGWYSRLSNQRRSDSMVRRCAEGIGVAILLTMTGIAVAQNPTPADPFPTHGSPIAVPEGYTAHHSVDLGGHIVNTTGSNAMYSTLVNLQSGPRVLGETFEMNAVPGKKHFLIDNLRAVGNGFGGDPNTFGKLDFSKAKKYEFSGLFRRDRQYFDYDLLGNPNISSGLKLNYGPSNAPTGTFAWPQVQHSPELFNTVRRMTDVNLTINPLSKVTYRVGYSRNTFEGPSLSPSYAIMKYDGLLEEYQRNSTDDFTGAIEWKPVQNTKLAFEEEIHSYKADSYFTLDPSSYNAQESDGTKVYLGNWDALSSPYGIGACNTKAMGSAYTSSTNYTIFTAPTLQNGLPTINAACSAVSSYMRSQPTRIITPTEALRFQSSSIKNLTMNGDLNYTLATMDLPHYYENAQGLDVVSATTAPVRSITYNGVARAHRAVVGINYAAVWQVGKTFSIADQVSYTNVQQPGYSTLPAATTLSTPSLATGTISYNGAMTTGTLALPRGINGTLTYGYYGQRSTVNNLTASWDASSRARLSLTYRYGTRTISQGMPHNVDIPDGALADPVNGNLTINQNGGIFNAALRPTSNWDLNGTAEMFYDDNALTPVAPRQTKRYRVHTKYRPRPWATLSAGFNDTERHNNTNNNQATVASGDETYDGPIQHEDHSRVISFGGVLAPTEKVGFDFNYAYSSVYTATNICYASGATAGVPGAVTASGTACPGATVRTGGYEFGPVKDFMDAPTQYGSVALALTPVKAIHTDLGYRVSSVNGTQFFNDARQVNGSLESTYVSPFANVAWTIHPGLIWKAEYNFFGYGEGGAKGAALCSTAVPTLTTPVTGVACSTLANTWASEGPQGASAPRNFHANNVTLGLHYEF